VRALAVLDHDDLDAGQIGALAGDGVEQPAQLLPTTPHRHDDRHEGLRAA